MHHPASRARFWLGTAALAAATFAAIALLDARVARLWLNSAYLAAGACCLAIPLGTLAALAIVKTDAPGRRLAALALVGMLLIPLFLVAGAWDAGFGLQGWYTLTTNSHLTRAPFLSGWTAAIWIHGLAAAPWVALIVGAKLASVEREIEEDASLVMSPTRVLWHVTLPSIWPAAAVAGLWVAMIASVEISVTDFFQVRTFAEEVYTQAALGEIVFGGAMKTPTAAAWWLGLFLFALLGGAVVQATRQAVNGFGKVAFGAAWQCRLPRFKWLVVAMLFLMVFLVAGVPIANLIYKAGGAVTQTDQGRERSWSAAKALANVAAAPQEFAGDLWLSAWVGAAAATASMFAGFAFAWKIRRARNGPTVFLLVMVLALCFSIPGPVLGIAVIHWLNPPPGSPLAFLAPLYDSQFPTWLVQTIRGLPLATLVLWAAFASVPQSLLETADLDGLGFWRSLAQVAWPSQRVAAAAAWLVAFAIAVSELAATVLVLPPGRSTAISVRVFQLLHYGADERVAAISIVLWVTAMLIAWVAAALCRRAA